MFHIQVNVKILKLHQALEESLILLNEQILIEKPGVSDFKMSIWND